MALVTVTVPLLALGRVGFDTSYVRQGGTIWRAWEAVWDTDRPVDKWQVGWTLMPQVFYSDEACGTFGGGIMLRDDSELFTCEPEGVKPPDPE